MQSIWVYTLQHKDSFRLYSTPYSTLICHLCICARYTGLVCLNLCLVYLIVHTDAINICWTNKLLSSYLFPMASYLDSSNSLHSWLFLLDENTTRKSCYQSISTLDAASWLILNSINCGLKTKSVLLHFPATAPNQAGNQSYCCPESLSDT